MSVKLNIVFPDGDAGDAERFSKQFQQLSDISNFTLFQDTPADSEEYLSRIKDADGILLGWNLPTEVMQAASRLKVVSFTGIGVEKFVDIPVASQQGITVCNCPGYADDTVAEHTLALLFSACRHVVSLDKQLRRGVWDQEKPAIELKGKSIGLIGFGGIGKRVSQICHALGMSVKVWTPSMNPEYESQYNISLCHLPELLETSDIISLHVASSERTRNLLDQKAFSQMKPGVVIVNTARGEIIEEGALLESLQSGHVRCAAMDVFQNEPLPAEHPFCALDNVILSPHVAFNSPQAVENLYQIGVDNLLGFFSGKPQNSVN